MASPANKIQEVKYTQMVPGPYVFKPSTDYGAIIEQAIAERQPVARQNGPSSKRHPVRKRCEFLIANTGNAAQESYDSPETLRLQPYQELRSHLVPGSHGLCA